MNLLTNQDGRAKRIFSAQEGQMVNVILLLEFQNPGTIRKRVRVCFKTNIFMACLYIICLNQLKLAVIF
jgi:hypothetical protein